MVLLLFAYTVLFCNVGAIPFEEFKPAWDSLLAKQNNSRANFSRDITDFVGSPVQAVSSTPYLSLIPGSVIIDSDVKCGQDNRNFCNYPALPFIETLNIPNILAGPGRLNKLPSGRCPDGYSKQPTMDCLNIAAAFIETTCCVFDTPPVTLRNFCTNRQGLQFSASFELCDGRSFIIADSNAWQVDDTFKILGGPYGLSTLTGGTVSSGVDSALVDSSCNVGFFQGNNLRWMNFPGKSASVDQNLVQLLGSIPTNLCGFTTCTATSVNFAVCPNNGFCMVSVNLTSLTGTVYPQLFLLAPGFNSFITLSTTPPGIPVTNNQDLATSYKNYIAASFIRSTNQLAFIDRNNNVYFYDPTGKFLSGPRNLFDLFGICGGVGSSIASQNGYVLYIPYPSPIYGGVQGPFNQSAYNAVPAYQTPPATVTYNMPQQPFNQYAQQPAAYKVAADQPQYQQIVTAPPQALATYNNPPPITYQAQPPLLPPQPNYNYTPPLQPVAAPVYAYQPYQGPQPAAPAYVAPAPPAYNNQPAPAVYNNQPVPQPGAPKYNAPSTPVDSNPPYQAPVTYSAAPKPANNIQSYAGPAPGPSYNPAPISAPVYDTYSAPSVNNTPAPYVPPVVYPTPASYVPAVPTYTVPPVTPEPVRYQQPYYPYPPYPYAPNPPQQAYIPSPPLPPTAPPAPAVPSVKTVIAVATTVLTGDPNDNTIFKPQFKPPMKEFFDVSAFVRNGRFPFKDDDAPSEREVKLV